MSSIFTYRIKLSILLIAFLFFGSCNTNDAPTPPNGNPPVVNKPDTTATNPPVVNKPDTTATNPPVVNKPDTTATNPPAVTIPADPSNTFLILKLSQQEYDYWNSHTISEKAAIDKVKAICKSEIYSVLKDDFDFIIFAMNNGGSAPPNNMPYGIETNVKNDIQGIGLSIYDNTSSFGSAGKLQSISFLYTNRIDLGPILHEITHRWANYVVPQNYGGHWDKVKGILLSVQNNFADIELYLAGAIPASDMKDPESLAIYNDPRFNNGNKISRNPDYTRSQKSFKALLVVVTPTDLTDFEKNQFKDRVANITRVPSQGNTHPNYQNMYNKTRGLLTLSIGELDKSKK